MAAKVYNDLLNYLTVRYEGTYMYFVNKNEIQEICGNRWSGSLSQRHWKITDFPANPWLHAISISSQPHTQLRKYDYMLSLKPAGHVQLALFILQPLSPIGTIKIQAEQSALPTPGCDGDTVAFRKTFCPMLIYFGYPLASWS